MKHLLVLAFAVLSLVACASEVVVEGEPSGSAGQGGGGGDSGGGATATTGSNTTTGTTANGCTMACTNKGASTCSCVQTCSNGSLSDGFRKVVCKPIPGGIVECVCTLDSGSFSGTCYEKQDQSCDFDYGCCANYFWGK